MHTVATAVVVTLDAITVWARPVPGGQRRPPLLGLFPTVMVVLAIGGVAAYAWSRHRRRQRLEASFAELLRRAAGWTPTGAPCGLRVDDLAGQTSPPHAATGTTGFVTRSRTRWRCGSVTVG